MKGKLLTSVSRTSRVARDQALAHPDIRIFESKGQGQGDVGGPGGRTSGSGSHPGTPVYSYLQPLSEYLLSISYQA